MRGSHAGLLGLMLVAGAAQGQFTYMTNDGSITITGYSGPGGAVTIPGTLNSLPVTSIGLNAFLGAAVASVTIPESVTSIGDYAFQDCSRLTNVIIQGSAVNLGEEAFSYCNNLAYVFFTGNIPNPGLDVFISDDNATAYYLAGTVGWSANLGELPALLWNPLIQTGGGSPGVSNNQFGFSINGTANIPVVVEACTNLASADWTPLQTLTLTNGSVYFSEALQTNTSGRYYRLSSP